MTGIDTQPLPVRTRIELAHAYAQYIADTLGIRVIHFKGYAAPASFYPPERRSGDVDLFVDPARAEDYIHYLLSHGWKLTTTFSRGSIFQHAANLWHDYLGYLDIHRSIPGVQLSPAAHFESLWAGRTQQHLAHYPCIVPDKHAHGALIVIHAARDSYRGARDTAFLRDSLSPSDWGIMREHVLAWQALAPWQVSTDEGFSDVDPAVLALWRELRSPHGRRELLRVRLAAAESLTDRLKILLRALLPNRAHLAMVLGRRPTMKDYLHDYGAKVHSWMRGSRQ